MEIKPMSVEHKKPQEPTVEAQATHIEDPQRREMLVSSGKYAAYTAPAMLSLLLPRQGQAQGNPPSPPVIP